MSFNTPWPSVYPDLKSLPPGKTYSIRVTVPKDEVRVLLSLAVNPAFLSYICQHAINAAVTYSRANNLTYLNADQLVEWVRERAVGGDNKKAIGSDEPTGDFGIRQGVTDTKTVTAGIGQNVASGRGGKEGVVGKPHAGGVGRGDAARDKGKGK